MNANKLLCAFMAVLAAIVTGAFFLAPHLASSGSHFTVDKIRGDTLGMSLDEYSKAHPGCADPIKNYRSCISTEETYAGLPATKEVRFMDGQLLEIAYNVKASSRSALLKALTQKYGEPQRSEEVESEWRNGAVTMTYLDFKSGASVRFELDSLRDKSYERDKMKKEEGMIKDQ